MSSRKNRRINQKEKEKISSSAKRQLILMIVSIVLMIFSIFQVYYLARYTLGKEIPADKLKVYRWVQKLTQGDQENISETDVENK